MLTMAIIPVTGRNAINKIARLHPEMGFDAKFYRTETHFISCRLDEDVYVVTLGGLDGYGLQSFDVDREACEFDAGLEPGVSCPYWVAVANVIETYFEG